MIQSGQIISNWEYKPHPGDSSVECRVSQTHSKVSLPQVSTKTQTSAVVMFTVTQGASLVRLETEDRKQERKDVASRNKIIWIPFDRSRKLEDMEEEVDEEEEKEYVLKHPRNIYRYMEPDIEVQDWVLQSVWRPSTTKQRGRENRNVKTLESPQVQTLSSQIQTQAQHIQHVNHKSLLTLELSPIKLYSYSKASVLCNSYMYVILSCTLYLLS